MRAEKQDAPVLSRWMKVLLGVSLAVLLAAAAVIGGLRAAALRLKAART